MPRLARFVDPGSAGRTLTGICPGLPSEAFKKQIPLLPVLPTKEKKEQGDFYCYVLFYPLHSGQSGSFHDG